MGQLKRDADHSRYVERKLLMLNVRFLRISDPVNVGDVESSEELQEFREGVRRDLAHTAGQGCTNNDPSHKNNVNDTTLASQIWYESPAL